MALDADQNSIPSAPRPLDEMWSDLQSRVVRVENVWVCRLLETILDPDAILTGIEHLIVSHHGARELGSPVEPMTEEAFILSSLDDLDATLHQVRRHVQIDAGEGEFTAYHPRLRRVLLKPSGR